jgi:hypothetical protein
VKLPVVFRSSSWLAVCGGGNFWSDAAAEHAWAAGLRRGKTSRTNLGEAVMPDYPPLSTQVIGQTESALGALLEPLLARTGITFHQ